MKKKILVALAVALASASVGAAIACAVDSQPKQYEYKVLSMPKGDNILRKLYNLESFYDTITFDLAHEFRGWKLLGGIAIDEDMFYQAIYREIKPQENSEAGANAPEGGTK